VGHDADVPILSERCFTSHVMSIQQKIGATL